ncbi:Membrane transport protein domain-containing protein [Desulfonema limicola]|uniref:Membrane transport protein domain-containing protein n=1 Tax=Desulfonema limicola TaxID=45656 RepID=A0A975BEF9_9BACT|nr:AEC family transporter [Desulfonema limicola]QTA83605.1 Membrane transport protein domain-containing protein [Desulfonema limicola]
MDILTTIIPIFSVIALGWLARIRGFIPSEFLDPANKLVFHLAIPAMIFSSISKGSLKSNFDPNVLAVTLVSLGLFFFLTRAAGLIIHVQKKQFGTFMQSSFHGNLGYIGLAVAFYFLGDQGLASASIIAGFIMILQNFMSVIALQDYSTQVSWKKNAGNIIIKIIKNPVIVSAIAGILFSGSGIQLPLVISRSLDILSGMALPLALLLIGSSLSFEMMRPRIFFVFSASIMKLILLPGLGLLLYRFRGIGPENYLPGLILLASPTATIAYVMAKEMGGDPDFAVAAISFSTLLSSITFSIWLNLTL